MKQSILIILLLISKISFSQEYIPLDTNHWSIYDKNCKIELYEGKKAIGFKGYITLKDTKFRNGTIEFDIYLKEEQAFPGVLFRAREQDGEQFFMRPHLSRKPDANQAAPLLKGITPWQLLFGSKYSFPYDYNFQGWTHVKLVVNEEKAQVYLDYADTAHLSWNFTMDVQEGDIMIRGGNRNPFYFANISVNKEEAEIKDFKPGTRKAIPNLIPEWEISDMFEEKMLNDISGISELISERTWQGNIQVEEGIAANISRKQLLYNGKPGNTVLAKTIIKSNEVVTKLFEFGYSDRVVVILNGKPIYRGTNKWRSRDYRYLGTVGLYDSVYLPLKEGDNELILAVSEDFGGWLVTGRIQ